MTTEHAIVLLTVIGISLAGVAAIVAIHWLIERRRRRKRIGARLSGIMDG
jgi:uncharacterized membrane protein YadS